MVGLNDLLQWLVAKPEPLAPASYHSFSNLNFM
jgi:hypothetical protein